MTRDEVIALAREAGIPIETDWAGRPSTLVIKDGGTFLRGVDDLERFAALVAAHEREECAKVCEERKTSPAVWMIDKSYNQAVEHCAAAIRSRK